MEAPNVLARCCHLLFFIIFCCCEFIVQKSDYTIFRYIVAKICKQLLKKPINAYHYNILINIL